MEKLIKILFCCHGNICRSTMAQSIFTSLADQRGVLSRFEIDSAATSREEIGNSMYPPAARTLARHGVKQVAHRARQMDMDDYRFFDRIVVMDSENWYNVRRMTGGDPDNKVSYLLDRPVEDPWYTDDFETAYQDILEGCELLLDDLT